jgi:Type IV pili methyl-accepting chemotaxis transducer N-term
VASLHVLNIAGRQRMLSQRIAKLCLMISLAADPSHLIQLRESIELFQKAIDYLCQVPLSSEAIRDNLKVEVSEWRRLRDLLDDTVQASALTQVCDASDRLLDVSEQLTDQYEQAMQILIGDRIGRMA